MEQTAFIGLVGPLARADMQKNGVLASLTIAQAILESGWGTSELAQNANALFGIKADSRWGGRAYSKDTKECYDGVNYTAVTALFRAYDSWEESVSDHSAFLLAGSRYAAVIGEKDYKTACKAIKAAGYATAPDYAEKLISLIERYGLTAYDGAEQEENAMALLTPNETYQMNGVIVSEKIIPDGTRWKDATKAAKAGFSAGSLYKKQQKLSGGTGKPKSVTIHNTNDLENVNDDAEQYTRATYNENMGSSRVHYYTDDTGAWQNLKAGTGLCTNDPDGSAEVSWHAGDGSAADGGNMTSLSIEIIMDESPEHDAKAKDNGARIAAWLLWKHGLSIGNLVTHTYWVNKSAGKTFSDVDVQCTNPVPGKKWCPTYIFASSNAATALKNWKAFKALVKTYLDALSGTPAETPAAPPASPEKESGTAFPATPFLVKVLIDDLNYRSEGSMQGTVKGQTGKGIFTITEVKNGWGKLKSDAGWIYLENPDYCTIQGSAAATPEPGYITYTVVKGDSLWAIAAKLLGDGNRYKEIKALSGLTSDTIYAGDVLKVPAK